jgi:hypothetical protein
MRAARAAVRLAVESSAWIFGLRPETKRSSRAQQLSGVVPYPEGLAHELICFRAYRVIRAVYGADPHGLSQLRDQAN